MKKGIIALLIITIFSFASADVYAAHHSHHAHHVHHTHYAHHARHSHHSHHTYAHHASPRTQTPSISLPQSELPNSN